MSSASTTATNWYTIRQFRVFQFIFGVYLTIHFAQLVPHVKELFSREGIIGNSQWNPTYGVFPNILNYIDYSPIFLSVFLVCLTILSILFAFRLLAPRLIAILLWYGWACLLNRNVLISNPGIPYVGLLLLAFGLINFTKQRQHNDDGEGKLELNPHVFPWIYWGAWILYAIGYTISGLHKLQSPSWLDGSALTHVLHSPLSRDNVLCHALLNMHPLVLQISTWASLIVEIAFLPLGLFYHARRIFWFAILALHLGVLLVINFTDLTLGILMMHFFLLDLRWFVSEKQKTSKTKPE